MGADHPQIPGAGAGADHSAGDARERALVAAIQKHGLSGAPGKTASAELLTRFQGRLFALCYRMLGDRDAAADLTQDAMVKIIQGVGGYDGRAKVSTWVIRITMNLCLSHLRSQKLRRHASLDAMSDAGRGPTPRGHVPGGTGSVNERVGGGPPKLEGALQHREAGFVGGRGEHSAEESVELRERRRRVAAALASLDDDQRSILILRDVQGLEYEQVGEVLGLNVGTVKSRLFRARVALREAVEGLGGE